MQKLRCVSYFLSALRVERYLPEGDDHDDSENTVAKCCPQHGARQLKRSVFQLFRHVGAGIWPNETPNGSRKPYQAGQTDIAPAATVARQGQSLLRSKTRSDLLERAKDLACRGVIRHDPESQKKREEAEYVHKENDPLRQRQMLCEEDVEADGQK